MSEPRRWWPASAADLRNIEHVVLRAVDAWLQEWVAEPCVADTRATLIDHTTTAASLTSGNAWSLGASVRVTIHPNAWDALVRRVLGLSTGGALAGDGLQASLLDSVRDDLLSDLLQRLVDALVLPSALPMPILYADTPEQQAQEQIRLDCLLDKQQSLFDMRLAEPWRWLVAPAAHASRSPTLLDRRRQALGDTRVKVAALLGRCELSLSELHNLAVGDVITTGQPLSAPIDVALLGTDDRFACVFANAQPGLTRGKASVQLTSIQETSP